MNNSLLIKYEILTNVRWQNPKLYSSSKEIKFIFSDNDKFYITSYRPRRISFYKKLEDPPDSFIKLSCQSKTSSMLPCSLEVVHFIHFPKKKELFYFV